MDCWSIIIRSEVQSGRSSALYNKKTRNTIIIMLYLYFVRPLSPSTACQSPPFLGIPIFSIIVSTLMLGQIFLSPNRPLSCIHRWALSHWRLAQLSPSWPCSIFSRGPYSSSRSSRQRWPMPVSAVGAWCLCCWRRRSPVIRRHQWPAGGSQPSLFLIPHQRCLWVTFFNYFFFKLRFQYVLSFYEDPDILCG